MVELAKKLAGFNGTFRFTVVLTKALPVLNETNTVATVMFNISFNT
jgi:hypothetical protein